MPANKRKLPLQPKPEPHHLRLSSRSRRIRYAADTESDSETTCRPIPVVSPKRSSHNQRNNAKSEESGDEYVDESEEEQAEIGQSHGDLDEDESPRLTIIPLEQMRSAGGVEYVGFRVHPNSLMFLTDLKNNNKRAWLKAHDGEFRRAFLDWETFVERTTSSVMSIDDTIPDLPAKDVMFRIYRDLRFSPDKKPYKAHFSAAWSRTGRKGMYAHYYIHCEPGASFIAGGIFAPNSQQLQRLRSSIDERPRRWRRALNENRFKQCFLPNVASGSGEDEALKHFARENRESALKTRPKGFIADHRDIELLKLRKFTVSKKIPDDLLCADDTQDKVTEILRPLVGFITFLNSIVMPDDDSNISGSDGSQGDA
ncbi:hypothetical protein BGZ61DRAFT_555646 [Ilyonectria robusta]|uniref:uncharacterized protein n=1 Tax=Ilyonectria robusta TaxID=1079257 RepID=UPI001E8DE0BF|nr:uncharacterized protein BGZ61DRAFT_555646 [Ilyonectria robusta]KAH8673210.1 hypothetical protein BGZ61DRAFT_555646 [Ilyonectria robusta]